MAQTAFILIYSTDEPVGQRLQELLRERHGHACKLVSTLDEAADSVRQRVPDLVVLNGDVTGERAIGGLFEALATRSKDAEVVQLGPGSPPSAPSGVRITTLPRSAEPADYVERLGQIASKAVARRDDRLLRQSLAEQKDEAFEGLIGGSPAILRIISRIRKASRNKLTVLILGETGTGKEVIANAIHKQSDRSRKQFLGINCAAFNENLLESELFGHVKGAFTGAVNDKKGIFVAADGGTLFLDEIGDMPLTMQVKLLRALDRREITPVGSTEVRRVDVRLIAATNADLREYVEQKKFREDLYYRLHQLLIRVPPLRERRQDIPLLAAHFLRVANANHGLSVDGISSEAMATLTRFFWPGNIRELNSVIEVTAVEVENRQIELDDLPDELRGSREIVPVATSMAGLTLAQVERLMIERTLQLTGGNREQAAKMLDIGTRTLYRKIKEYGL